jgi:hypothetical protein
MPVTADKSAPYAPVSTILDVISRYRSRGLPSPITSEVLGRAGIPESLHPRTLQSLQTLDLIDEEGKPTSTFEGLRLAPQADFQKRLEEWIKGAYADIFSFVDPMKDDETRIRDAFRGYKPVGQQERMVTLFQGLCTAAGLIEAKSRVARPPSPDQPKKHWAVRKAEARRAAGKAAGEARAKNVNEPASNGFSGLLPAPLAGLLSSLPPNGDGWSKAQREKFLTTFEAVLDFCFPILSDAELKQGTSENETAVAR